MSARFWSSANNVDSANSDESKIEETDAIVGGAGFAGTAAAAAAALDGVLVAGVVVEAFAPVWLVLHGVSLTGAFASVAVAVVDSSIVNVFVSMSLSS